MTRRQDARPAYSRDGTVYTCWRATLERGKGASIAFAVDTATQQVTLEASHEDPAVNALGDRLAALAGPQGLVAGEESVAVFVPERPRPRR